MEAALPRTAAHFGIRCVGLSSGYLGSRVLRNVSFEAEQPAIYVVLGPNGAGKTTLFRTLAGILRPYEGRVTIEGEPLGHQSARDRLHFLSHIDGIPDGLRVREALEFYARVQGASPDDVRRVLDLLEITELQERYFSELSAGQRKRVSIARVFMRERDIYLLDEPTSNLDPKVAGEIRDLILELAKNKVVLYSSHNLYEARDIGRFVLAIRDGTVAYFGELTNMRTSRYVVGIRVLAPSEALAASPKQGEYYLYQLPGPESVPALLKQLQADGVQIREVREMSNPLEELFR
jgi:ABC-2 type transport system ATP-binding protein